MSFNPLMLIQEGTRVEPNRLRYLILAVLSIPLTVFEVWYGIAGRLTPLELTVPFLGVLYAAAFLTISIHTSVKRILWIDYLLAALSFACCAYILYRVPAYNDWIVGLSVFPTEDLVVGVTLMVLTAELTRRCVGFGLSIWLYCGIAYVLWGDQLPGMMSHRSTDAVGFVERMILSTNGGLFTGPVQVAAEYAFLFIVFGRLLEQMNGGKFFYNLAAAIAGKRTGGTAKVCLISSGMFGMISGSPAADVMVTGPINIPTMKRVGYTGVFAAGLEAIASTGGSLVPPVMGTLVFLMADFTNVPYVEICVMALGVAFLYYMALYVHVHFRSQRLGIEGFDNSEIPSVGRTLLNGWTFILPFGVLIYMMVAGFSVAYTAAVALLVAAVIALLRRTDRLKIRDLVDTCVSACAAVGPLLAAIACAGLIEGIFNATGVTGKISSAIFALTGGSMFWSLVAAMVIVTILGMGMPTVAAYALGAILLAPFLIEMGMEVFIAHFFIGYYAVLSAISPPVAIACYCASTISGDHPMKVTWSSVSLASVIYVIPFIFAYQPGLLLMDDLPHIVLALTSAASAVWLAAVAIEGWYKGLLPIWFRTLVGLSAVACVWPIEALSLGGMALGFGLILLHTYVLLPRLAGAGSNT